MKFIDENILEESLRLAVADPLLNPAFCQLLLKSSIYVLGQAEDNAPDAQTKMQIQQWQLEDGTAFIPFFTSLPQLQQTIAASQSYLALPATSLFSLTLGHTLVLNPDSALEQRFSPKQIRELLTIAGSGAAISAAATPDMGTELLLGQPVHYPEAMVQALRQYFASQPVISKAYLVLMQDKVPYAPSRLVVGVQAVDDALAIDAILQQAGRLASSAAELESVDFYHIRHADTGLSQYFLTQCTSFYDAGNLEQ